jgi:hypothetical protein
MMSHFSEREKSGATFHLIKTLHSDLAVPTSLYTFNKSIGKSVIKGKRPETLYLYFNKYLFISLPFFIEKWENMKNDKNFENLKIFF